MIKRTLFSVFAVCALVGFSSGQAAEPATSSPTARVHHVVIVWLKAHGDPAARDKYIEISRTQAKLPMVVRYQIGTAVPGGREVVDGSYDVAIVASFENREALDAYLQHPEHKKVIEEGLKPLVDRFIVYDFAEAP